MAAVYEEVWNTELEKWGSGGKNTTVILKRDYGVSADLDTLPALGASIWKIKRRVNVRKNAKKIPQRSRI